MELRLIAPMPVLIFEDCGAKAFKEGMPYKDKTA